MNHYYLEQPRILEELEYIYNNDEFRAAQFLYMAMGNVWDHRVCIWVAYKIDYAIKKALQFIKHDENVSFTHINKVRVGEKEVTEKFELV